MDEATRERLLGNIATDMLLAEKEAKAIACHVKSELKDGSFCYVRVMCRFISKEEFEVNKKIQRV